MNKLILFFIIIVTFSCFSCEAEYPDGENPVEIIVGEEVTDPDKGDYVENFEVIHQIEITYSETEAYISTSIEGINVNKTNNYLTIESSVEGVEYILSGSSDNGCFKIYSDYKFKLTLDHVTLTNSKGAAINIQTGKTAFIVANPDTDNTFTDGSSYTTTSGEDMKGCVFSEGQLIFSGEGTVNVNGNYKHAICSDDYVILREDCTINILYAASDGIHMNDYSIILGGNITINAAGEGIECEKGNIAIHDGTINITTIGDKGHGLKSAGNTRITDGLITIKVSGAASKGIKATGDLTIHNGTFLFTTSGNALYESDDVSSAAGIKCCGNIIISNADITITSSGTAGKGISADGSILIENGNHTINTTGKRYSQNRQTSSAKGIKSKSDLTINGGNFLVNTNGGNGSEGIESKATLTINDGTIEVTAYDDAINASKAIVINGGNIYCYSSNNDGVDSNGTLTVTGGLIIASGTTSPEDGFDCDNNTFKITGGILIGTGGSTGTPTSNVCTQYSLIYKGISASANQILKIESPDGIDIVTYKIPRSYSSMTLLFSSPDLAGSTTYTVYSGGNVDGGNEFNGYYTNATYSGGNQLTTFTTSSLVTQIGSSGNSGSGPGGGFPR